MAITRGISAVILGGIMCASANAQKMGRRWLAPILRSGLGQSRTIDQTPFVA
jgi:hypothetical protein